MDLSEIRILLLGDDNVGRTSLIYSLVSEDVVPSSSNLNLTGDSLRPTTDDISIPPEVTRARVPTVIMDYCGRQPMSPDEIDDLLLPMECPSPNPLLQSSRSLYSCIRQAHVICLVYAFDSRESRDRLLTVWLPLIDRSATTIPIILVANKCDLIDENNDNKNDINHENREFFRLTMLKYSRIEACIETSTRTMKNISELFYSAQKCVLYPINYLQEQNKLTKRFKQCLKRIFTIADQDNDQLLNDFELTTLQDYCFGKIQTNDQKTTIEQLKKEIKRRTVHGIKIINDQTGLTTTALTYQGFECLFELYLNKGKYETIYTTLERFSYNRKLELCVPNAPDDLTGELSPSAVDYLTRLFRRFDSDNDSCLTLNELNQLFESLIDIIPPISSSLSNIKHCIYLRLSLTSSKTPLLTLSGFLAQWFFLAHSQPSLTYSYLFQLGYSYGLSIIDDTNLPSRMTYICHVYGMPESGKSSFLKRFVSSTIYQVHHSADLAEKSNNKTKAFFSYDYLSKSLYKQIKFYAIDFVRVLNETKCLILEECHTNDFDEKIIFKNANINCFLIDRTHPRAFSNVATIYLQHHVYPRLPCLFILTKADQPSVKQDYPLPIEFFCRQHKIPLPIDYSSVTTITIYSNNKDNNQQLTTNTEHMSQSWFTSLLFRSHNNSTRTLEPYSPRGDKTRHQDDIYVRLGYLCVYPKLNYFTNSTNDFYNTDALLKYSLYASVVTLGLVTVARMFR
ncbi:unnamed protein product [Rotaria sordida]|uniref:EF-hand domain-containing protein n=1 Tax=Rotaria sordida TaxID=392033 RepID=A0A814V2H9_9BILA|nr:unnamed protein product [Rotaria sordida]CAF1097409.1 unnamed protein product [Rotaria sordida]CAF1181085.1 unnamed protein product [Rotaria sordida]CAF1210429.1 unnamed protein product [Rotaria sordida]CAF1211046.1 unnamed protein product [Rotaria sordida]